MFEQSGIKEKELELVKFVKSGKRMFHLRDIIDAVKHPGRNKPFDRFFKIPRFASLPNSTIDKLFIRFGELGDDTAEYHQNTSAVYFPVMLRKIIFVDFDEFLLNLRNRSRILMVDP